MFQRRQLAWTHSLLVVACSLQEALNVVVSELLLVLHFNSCERERESVAAAAGENGGLSALGLSTLRLGRKG